MCSDTELPRQDTAHHIRFLPEAARQSLSHLRFPLTAREAPFPSMTMVQSLGMRVTVSRLSPSYVMAFPATCCDGKPEIAAADNNDFHRSSQG
jgi:hypothetical protein